MATDGDTVDNEKDICSLDSAHEKNESIIIYIQKVVSDESLGQQTWSEDEQSSHTDADGLYETLHNIVLMSQMQNTQDWRWRPHHQWT